MQRFLLIGFALYAGFLTTSAQSAWQSVNGPVGGFVSHIYANVHDQLYARFADKLWSSSDLGKNWLGIFEPCRTFQIGGDGFLYAEDFSRNVHISMDWGSNWTAFPRSRSDYNLDHMAISSTGVYYFASGGIIYASNDRAMTWKPLNGDFQSSAERIKIDAQDNLYVFGKNNLFVSKDDGKTWQLLFNQTGEILDFVSQNGLYLSVSTGSGGNIWKSTDSGSIWKLTNIPFAQRLVTLSEDGLAGTFSYEGAPSGSVFISSNGGTTSKVIDVGLPVYCLTKLSNGNILAGSADGIWLSTNSGSTFTVEMPFAAQVIGLAVSSTQRIFSVTRTRNNLLRFWYQRDASFPWTEVDKKQKLGEPAQFDDLLIFPDNRIWLTLGYQTDSDEAVDRTVLFESSDGGSAWTSRRESSAARTEYDFDKSAGTLVTCYTWDTGGDLLHRSSDYGNVWIPKRMPFYAQDVLASSGGLLYGVGGGQEHHPTDLYRSFNKGDDWENKKLPTSADATWLKFSTNKFGDLFQVISLPSGQSQFALVSILRSVNSGDSWMEIAVNNDLHQIPSAFPPYVVSDANGILFFVHSASILKSIDNGDIWEDIYKSGTSLAEIQSFFPMPEAVYAGTVDAGVWKNLQAVLPFQPRNINSVQYPLAATFGVHWVDYDMDGDDDLFLVNAGRNHFFRNNNGALTRLSSGEIALDDEPSIAASWGDYNNDGFPDCYVCNEGVQNSLYKNNGDGTFKKITSGNIVEDQGAFRACAWADVNRDGHLDLYLTNRDGANVLYVNDGTAHFYKDYSDIIGLASDLSYGCSWCDFDNDGDMDIYICNDGVNKLYEQVSPMKFSAVSPGRIPASGELSIGCSWGDYNNDGYMDLFVTNAESANKLYTNLGNGSFALLNNGAIASDVALSKGSGWADYDNDGFLDLIVSANGAGFLYRNRGDGTFEKWNNQNLLFFAGNSLSMAWGDVTNDGNLDFLVSSSDRKSLLYQNLGNKNKWLKVRCEGTISNKLAIGAKIRVKATIDGKKIWQTREINSQSGHRAQGSFVQHFGLGQTAIVDSLVLIWPTQKRQILTQIAANQMIDIVEDNASSVKMDDCENPSKFGLQPNYPNPFNSSTTIVFDVPAPADITLQLYDARGQLVKTLVRGPREAGRQTVLWDGCDDQGKSCSSGVYVCRLSLEQAVRMCKITLLK